MKKYMSLILLLAAIAACLMGCGRSDKAQEQEIENAPVDENAMAESNIVPTEDPITQLQYCDGSITLRFTHDAESGAWRWVDEPTFPLDGIKVDEVITALKELGQLETLSTSADAEVYGLDDPQKYLTLKTETVDGILYIGDQAEDGSWYASLEGYEDMFIVPDEFVQLLSRSIYDMAVLPTLPAFTAENLLSVEVVSGDKRVYMNQTEGQWNSVSEQLAGRAEEVVNTLAALQVSKCFDFLPSQQALHLTGFSTPTATITVEYLNSVNVESSFSMTLGALRSAEEGYYATLNDDSTIYLIPSTQVSPLLVLLIYAK